MALLTANLIASLLIDGEIFMDLMVLGPEMMLLLFVVGFIAAFIDAIAGGGGLLTLPTLLAVGLTPSQAIATNKLQSVGGSFTASLYFVRSKVVNLRQQSLNILMAFIGAVIGSLLIQHLDTRFLHKCLPILIMAIGLWFLFMPKLGMLDSSPRLTGIKYALVGASAIGFYDGFFGPGCGSFYTLAFVTLAGFNLAKATAHAKVLNCTSNLASLIVFLFGGKLVWAPGLVMLAGALFGARMGARMVLTRGQQLIRPMVVVVSMVMSGKLLWDNYGLWLKQQVLFWL
jgi:uncharacterized protein